MVSLKGLIKELEYALITTFVKNKKHLHCCKCLIISVETTGFEPVTPCL